MSSIKTLEALFSATIKFVPELSNDAFSFYAVMSGKEPIFDAVVNNLTQEISASFPDMTQVEIDAKVKMKPVMTEEGVTSRPSSDSVKSIIYPRIIPLLLQKMSGAAV